MPQSLAPLIDNFDQLHGQIAASQIPGGAVTSHGLIVVAASNSPSVLRDQADYVCDGTDDQVEVQAAIDACATRGGGTVALWGGLFAFPNPAKIKSTVDLTGWLPRLAMTSSHPDMGWSVPGGGTVVTGPGKTLFTADVSANDAVQACKIRNLVLKDCAYGIDIGSADAWGLAHSTLEHLWLCGITGCGIRLTNFQRLFVQNVQMVNAHQGFDFVADFSTDRSPGNSEFSDLYVHSTSTDTTDGLVVLRAENNAALAHCIFTRLQANQYATRSGPVMKIAGAVIGCNVYGLDLERMPQDTNDVLTLTDNGGVQPNRLLLVITEAKKVHVEEALNVQIVNCYENTALFVNETSAPTMKLSGSIGSFLPNSYRPPGLYTVGGAFGGDIPGAALQELSVGSNAGAIPSAGVTNAHVAVDAGLDPGKFSPAYLTARVATSFNKTDTTLANVPGLSVPVAAGRTYAFRAVLFVNCGDGGDGGAKAGVGGTCTATNILCDVSLLDVSNGWAGFWRLTAPNQGAGDSSRSVPARVELTGHVAVSQAGTLTVQFAQAVGGNGTSSVLAGSHLIVHEIL